MLEEFVHQPRIAYFSMEIALRDDIPTYSGGLGVLAGDTIRSAVDLDIPIVAVSLVSRAGYFKQEIDAAGRQVERPDLWDPAGYAAPTEAKIAVMIGGREVWVRSWLYEVQGHRGGKQPVILLDTDLEENQGDDRRLTHHLYGGDEAYRIKQEMILGIGGVRMLHALGFRIRQYHLNEGHSAFLALELLRRFVRSPEEAGSASRYDVPRVRELCNFTTHTPLESAHDQFSYDLVNRVLSGYMDLDELKRIAGQDRLNMTRLALNLSEYVNGVAKRHAEVSQRSFSGYRIHAITNGVHPYTWTCASFRRLYDRYLPAWCHEPELLVRIDQVPDEQIWAAHVEAKNHLIMLVEALSGIRFNPELPIIGFARRMTAYKRPDLLFSDLERLKALARMLPFQVVMAGKAHPRDDGGKQLIERLNGFCKALAGVVPVVFFPNYALQRALDLASGVDLWLNTPLRPLEASGTSGMKAAFNGVPQLSVLDGWWLEGCVEGVTGWAIGDSSDSKNGNDAASLYEKLEHKVLPLYAKDRRGWITVMKGAIGKNASYFNSHRMMRRYATEAYIR